MGLGILILCNLLTQKVSWEQNFSTESVVIFLYENIALFSVLLYALVYFIDSTYKW